MTRILEIDGTVIRMEIETCHGCPLQTTDRDGMPSGCPYLDWREARDCDEILEDCPLPEKVAPHSHGRCRTCGRELPEQYMVQCAGCFAKNGHTPGIRITGPMIIRTGSGE